MSKFDEKLRLKEKAEEDRYFARKDRELIRALHEEQAREAGQADQQGADAAPQQPATTSAGHDRAQDQTGGYLTRLIARVLRFVKGKTG